jgi:hypothetical protein
LASWPCSARLRVHGCANPSSYKDPPLR